MKKFRKYIVTGLLVWLPIVVTVLLFRFLITLMDQTLVLLPVELRPESLIGFKLPGIGLILTLVVLIFTGVFAANYVGKTLVTFGEKLFARIPIVRSVYTAAKNFAEIVFSDTGQSFKKVLLIQYPRKGVYSLAFQTSTSLGEVQKKNRFKCSLCFCSYNTQPYIWFYHYCPKRGCD